MTKTFSLFLMLALVLGVSLGGAFVGGVVLGKSQGQTSTEEREAGRLSSEAGRQSPGQFGGDRSDRPNRGFRPGGSLEQGQEGSRDRLRDRADLDSDGRRFGDRAGIFGTVERVDGDNVTVTTPRGPVTVTVGPETAIQRMVEGSLQDLKEEVRIRVIGPRDEEGNVQARAIILIPAGVDGVFGQGRHFGDRAGIFGTVDVVEGDNVTVSTPRGPVTVTVGPETAIQRVVEGSLQDLKEEVRIRVTGSRDEEGNLQATAITLVPEGAEGIFGRRGTRRER